MIDLRSARELVRELAEGVAGLFRQRPVETPPPITREGLLEAQRVIAELRRAHTVHVACHPHDAPVFRQQIGRMLEAGIVELHESPYLTPGKAYGWTGELAAMIEPAGGEQRG